MSAPFIDDPDFTLWVGDVREVLARLEPGSVDCVITSPPYWGLRDYGTGAWDGGDSECDHRGVGGGVKRGLDKQGPTGTSPKYAVSEKVFHEACGKCGATRQDQQLGLEPTPDEYVRNMVAVFREVRRVLAPHGTCWVNLGDSYASGEVGRVDNGSPTATSGPYMTGKQKPRAERRISQRTGLKPKDLVGIPWRIAFALQQPYYAGKIANENDRTWLAAIIDGEGSIALNYLRPSETNDRRRDYYGPYLRVHNTCEAIVRRCAELTGVGSVKVHDSRRRPVFVWAVYGVEAREVLREVYPYLVAKQHEARLAYAAPGASDCYAALKLLHRGSETMVDRPAPPSCLEPGWYLRSDIVWSKPNPMPESVTDRPTKAHEYVFLLTKQPRYWFDREAVREPPSPKSWNDSGSMRAGRRPGLKGAPVGIDDTGIYRSAAVDRFDPAGRNVRSVWEIATQPYPEAHFATYPEELVRRCLLAGCPEWVCRTCGKPRERIVERSVFDQASISTKRQEPGMKRHGDGDRNLGGQQFNKFKRENPDKFVGWSECNCLLRDPAGIGNGATSKPQVAKGQGGPRPLAAGSLSKYRPGVVLDPFLGSGTTALVARRHGRACVGIELNPTYAELAARRLQQLSLLA